MQLTVRTKLLKILAQFQGDALWLYLSRFGAVFLQSLTLFSIAAFVSMEEFGRFSYMFSASRVASVVIGLGGGNFLLRELSYREAKEEGGGNEIFVNVFFRTFLFAGIIFLLYYLVLLGITLIQNSRFSHLFILLGGKDFELNLEIILVLVTGFFFSILQILIAVLRVAKSATFSMVLNDCFPYLIFLIIFFIYLKLDIASAEMIMLAFCGALVFCSIAAFVFSISYLNACKRKNVKNKKIQSREYLTFWGGSIVGALLAQSDILIAKYFIDDATLGIYALLRRMSNLISLPQVIVNWSLNVEVARQFKLVNRQALQENATRGLFIAVPVTLLIFLGISITSPFWASLFDLELTSEVLFVFMILMFGQLINVMSGANLLFANQCREEYFVFKARVLSVFLGFIIMPIGIIYWGLTGLAIGCAIPLVILNFIVTYRVRKKIGVWTSIPIFRFGDKSDIKLNRIKK